MGNLTGSIDRNDVKLANVIEEIERIKLEKNVSYTDAALLLAEEMEWEPDWIAPYISGPIKERLRVEGEESGLLKRTENPAFRFE